MTRRMGAGSRRLYVVALTAVGAVALLWWAGARRDAPPPAAGDGPITPERVRPGDVPARGPGVAEMSGVSWPALIEGAEQLCDRYRSDAGALAPADRASHLRLCLELLQATTFRYYDWVAAHPRVDLASADITHHYLLPVFSTIADANPGVENAPGMSPSDHANALRRYLGLEGFLFYPSVVYSDRGPGRFPSCELGRISVQRQLGRDLWGQRVEATLYVVDGYVIRDVVSYLEGASWGAPMVTMGSEIVHRLPNEQHFIHSLREDIAEAFQHRPTRLETDLDLMPPATPAGLRRELAFVALAPMRALGPDQALVRFLEKWRETGYIHELAHIFVKNTGVAAAQSPNQEMIAYLTELRYGDTPHYTLCNISVMGEDRPLDPHGRAMHLLFDAFALRIIEAKRDGEGFEGIDCSFVGAVATRADLERVALQFARLSQDEIRSLALRVFDERFGE